MKEDDIPPENSNKLLNRNLIPYLKYFENPNAVFHKNNSTHIDSQ
jgi:hypothetical protein